MSYNGIYNVYGRSGLKVIKNSCSTQLSMKFFLLTNVNMPTIAGILTFISGKNSIIGISEPEKKTDFLDIFIFMSISCSAELCMKIFL